MRKEHDRTAARPMLCTGVSSASAVASLPLMGDSIRSGFEIEGQPAPMLLFEQLVLGRAEICRFSPYEWPACKPFEFVVYPRASPVGFLARLLEPRPDCSVHNYSSISRFPPFIWVA